MPVDADVRGRSRRHEPAVGNRRLSALAEQRAAGRTGG